MGIDCIPRDKLKSLTELAHFVAEVANLPLPSSQSYVGSMAFRHKAGLHASAISREENSYNHIDPKLVGNCSSISMSDLGGRSSVVIKAKEFEIHLTPDEIERVAAEVDKLENQGYQFEGADASLQLIMARTKPDYAPSFEILERDVRSRQIGDKKPHDSAAVRIKINNGKKDISYCVADGDGPIDALANAVMKALLPHFPFLEFVDLVDYKVRVLPGKKGKRGTTKAVRILIDFSDGISEWTTVGCSTDSISASMQALADGLETAILLKDTLFLAKILMRP